jgi:phage-related protein
VPRDLSLIRRWRFYATASGRRPVREFIERLNDVDAAQIAAAMVDVRQNGLRAARHLRAEVYEVRAEGVDASYRLLFAEEGAKGQVLLALHAISKKTQKTPPQAVELAERRLADWRRRGRVKRV